MIPLVSTFFWLIGLLFTIGSYKEQTKIMKITSWTVCLTATILQFWMWITLMVG